MIAARLRRLGDRAAFAGRPIAAVGLRRWWRAPAAAGLALATWPFLSVRAGADLDSSWVIGLHLAAARGLDHGRDVVFTYGPLGFLLVPRAVTTATAAASIAVSLAVWLVLSAAVLAGAARAFPAPAAVLLAYAALSLPLQFPDTTTVIAFFAAVWLLERGAGQRRGLAIAAAAGAYAGFVLLVKLSSGVTALVLLALAVWRLRPGPLRSELALLASAAAAVAGLWLSTGNALSLLPHWLHDAVHVVTGYTDTAAADSHARLAQYGWAGALCAVGILLLALQLGRREAALWLAGLGYAYAYLKEGFVRHDAHDVQFFAAFGLGALAFAWRAPAARVLAGVTVLAATAAVVATPELGFGGLFHPLRHASRALDDVRLVASPGRVRAEIDTGRAQARAQLAVSPRSLALLRGRSVDVVPYESSAVWAYDLAWRPEPVLQDYAAFDAHLDRENAREIEAHGADRILRDLVWPTLDATHPLLEAPATSLARICRYRSLGVDGKWEVLARTADRCGPPRRLASASARAGEPVAVPRGRPGELVYARVRLRRGVADRLARTLFKPLHEPRIVLGTMTYRFVAASAADPLLLRLPSTSELSAYAGGRVDYDRLTLLNVPSPFRVEFYAEALRGRAAAAAPPRPPAGTLEPGALVLGGRRVRVVPGAVSGFVDASLDWGRGGRALTGWAVDARRGVPARQVAVFVAGRLAGLARPTVPRPDVAAAEGAPAAVRSGYRVRFRWRDGLDVRVFGVAGGRASELSYGAGDVWPHG
ncbi:MAG TPA: hypothetical protein VFB42_10760 [Gaiellaceae bacterium]|nr:hypothetical protein [Gaiellaceae bacterium]